jgi:hypothetical protein
MFIIDGNVEIRCERKQKLKWGCETQKLIGSKVLTSKHVSVFIILESGDLL